MRPQNRIEFLFFCGMLLLGIALFVGTFFSNTDVATTAQQSAVFYPRIILTGWIIVGCFAVVNQIRRKDLPPSDDLNWRAVVLGLVIVAAFILGMRLFGFLVPAIAFSLLTAWFLGYRKLLPMLLCGVLFPLGLDFLFNDVLMLLLPTASISFGG
jgi:hypothetical protein